MKFPITRERLQEFDPVQEKKDKDEITIQNHINMLVNNIGGQIENILSWTMPKPGGMAVPQSLITNAKHAHEAMMAQKQFVWRDIKNIRNLSYSRNDKIDADDSVLITLLVQKLKETFIGCDIIVDPLKTYLIIDWS
jgi:hypothetical protein